MTVKINEATLNDTVIMVYTFSQSPLKKKWVGVYKRIKFIAGIQKHISKGWNYILNSLRECSE